MATPPRGETLMDTTDTPPPIACMLTEPELRERRAGLLRRGAGRGAGWRRPAGPGRVRPAGGVAGDRDQLAGDATTAATGGRLAPWRDRHFPEVVAPARAPGRAGGDVEGGAAAAQQQVDPAGQPQGRGGAVVDPGQALPDEAQPEPRQRFPSRPGSEPIDLHRRPS